jgi:hypothetical protein
MSETNRCTAPHPNETIDANGGHKRHSAGAGQTLGSRAYRVSAGINIGT